MIEKKKAQLVIIDYKCDKEGCDGHMRHNGDTLMGNPPIYPHKCDKCGAENRFSGKKYPYTVVIEEGTDLDTIKE